MRTKKGHFFTENRKRKPFLDVVTKWNSTYEIVMFNSEKKLLLTTLTLTDDHLSISEELRTYI